MRISARRYSHIFAEGFHEIAAVVEAAAVGHLRHREFRGGKDVAGAFDPVIVQIVHGCAVQGRPEKTAEILGTHPRQPRKVREGDGGGVIGVDVFQNGLEHIHLPPQADRFFP